MTTVLIKIGGVDVTDIVRYADTLFVSQVNGSAGACQFAVRDTGHDQAFTFGQTITLDIDGDRRWTGFVEKVIRQYSAEVVDTSEPAEVTRWLLIQGFDNNVLFSRRVVHDGNKLTAVTPDPAHDDPAHADQWLAGTHSDDIVRWVIENHTEMPADGVTLGGVEDLGSPNPDLAGAFAAAMPVGAFMREVNRLLGGIFYLKPDFEMVHRFVETATTPYYLSDRDPASLVPPPSVLFEDHFNRTVGAWGWGNGWSLSSGGGSMLGHGTVDGSHATSDAHQYFNATNSAIPDFEDFDITFDFQAEAVGDGSQNWYLYIYLEAGSSRMDIYPTAAPDASPYEMTFEINGSSWVDAPYDVVAGNWYSVHWQQSGGGTRLRVWPQGDAEPGSWLVTNTGATIHRSFLFEVDGGFSTPTLVDNLVIVGPSDLPPPEYDPYFVGPREYSFVSDGAEMINDALVWGTAAGVSTVKFAREQDAASIALHGRWQYGEFNQAMYKQASLNQRAEALVYGNDASRHGAKDDRLVVLASVFEPVFFLGDVVRCEARVFDTGELPYETGEEVLVAILPVRRITMSFPTPTDVRYDLMLSQELDEPWNIHEYRFPKLKPWPWGGYPWPEWEWPPIGEEGGCSDSLCGITDTFTRDHPGAQAWGYSDSGGVWDVYSDETGGFTYMHEVVDGRGHTTVSAGGGYTYSELRAPGGTEFSVSHKFQIGRSGAATPDVDAGSWAFGMNWCNTFISGGTAYTRGWALSFNTALGYGPWLVLPHRFAYNHADNDYMDFTADWEYDVEYQSRYEVDATEQRLKVWKTSDPEPSSWTLVNTLTGPTLAMTIGYFELYSEEASSGAMELYLDDLDISGLTACDQYRYDNFNRTISQAWGETDFGGGWTTSGAAVHGVNGSQAYVTNGAITAWVPGAWWDLDPFTLTARFYFGSGAGTRQISFAVSNGDNLAEYAQVFLDGTGNFRVTDNIDFNLSEGDFASLSLNSWYRLKWQFEGGVHRAKYWQENTAEPDWIVETTLPDLTTRTYLIASLTASGAGQQTLIDYIDIEVAAEAMPCYADCSGAVTVSDVFTRTVNPGWGTSTSGHSWHDSPTTGLNTTGGSRGNMVPTTSGSAIQNWIPVPIAYYGFSFKIRVHASRAFVDSGTPFVFDGDFFAIFFTSGGVGTYDVIIGGTRLGVDADGGSASPLHGISETTQFWIAGEWGGPGSNFNVYVWQSGNQPGTPTATIAAVASFPVDQFRLYTIRAGTALTVDVDDIIFQTKCAPPVPPGEATSGLPMTGFVCETIEHSGGNDFSATRAFKGEPEIYVNSFRVLPGPAHAAFSFNGADGTISLASSISGSDMLRLCYEADGVPN